MAHIAGNGNDTTIDGAALDDLIVGHRKDETISGLDGNDTIYGGYGSDTILGGNGADRLDGGLNADVLTGGAGADTFVINGWYDSPDQTGGRDHITDFEAQDFIDLKGIEANIGGAVLTMANIEIEVLSPGEFRVHVHVIPGNTTWDAAIDVTGIAPTAANFIF